MHGCKRWQPGSGRFRNAVILEGFAMKSSDALRFWFLDPVNPNEPPFPQHGVPACMIVAAPNEDAARRLASHDRIEGHVWLDADMARCAELSAAVTNAGIVARDMGV
jgi:hypothetical protein